MRLFTFLLLFCTVGSAQVVTHVRTLGEAIAKAEGFHRKGSIPSRCNNPGDLKVVREYRYPGQVGVCKGGHAKFRTPADGWAALDHQIDKVISGQSKRYTLNMSLKEIGRTYAQNYKVWSRNVAHNLGVPPETYLWEILDTPPTLEETWLTK